MILQTFVPLAAFQGHLELRRLEQRCGGAGGPAEDAPGEASAAWSGPAAWEPFAMSSQIPVHPSPEHPVSASPQEPARLGREPSCKLP